MKPKLDDYCSNHSEGSHERKDVKELETLIEYKVAENNNIDTKTGSSSMAHEQNA